jgi:hypothetical protein
VDVAMANRIEIPNPQIDVRLQTVST